MATTLKKSLGALTDTLEGTTLNTTGNVTLGDATTDTLAVGVSGLVKTANNNVLIGTTTDDGANKLQVAGSMAITGAITQSDGTAAMSISTDNANNGHLRVTTAHALRFSTNATERMRIISTGEVGIGLTPTTRNNTRLQIVDGIGFPATQVASSDANTLDDYEEGTWTPALTFATAGNLSVSYSTQVGRYTKIGNLVTVSGTLLTSAFTHTTASGNAQITGLPFTAENVSGLQFYGAVRWQGITKASYTDVSARVEGGGTYLILSISGSGQSNANVQTGDMPTGGSVVLSFTVSYRV